MDQWCLSWKWWILAPWFLWWPCCCIIEPQKNYFYVLIWGTFNSQIWWVCFFMGPSLGSGVQVVYIFWHVCAQDLAGISSIKSGKPWSWKCPTLTGPKPSLMRVPKHTYIYIYPVHPEDPYLKFSSIFFVALAPSCNLILLLVATTTVFHWFIFICLMCIYMHVYICRYWIII